MLRTLLSMNLLAIALLLVVNLYFSGGEYVES